MNEEVVPSIPETSTLKVKSKPRRTRERSASPYRIESGQTNADFVNKFWQHTTTVAEEYSADFKQQSLPLARIKKVMKSDPEVKMISSEVTIILEKACQIFIQELTARSHLVGLASGRRTLSKPDVVGAITKSDMYDFLIDIIPRNENSEEFTATGRKKKVKTEPVKERRKRRISDKDEGEEDELEDSE